MERTTFLKNYRIRLQYDGSPYEPDRNGSAISYEAVDERTGEPVSVTLIPAASIDLAEREEFEEHISSAQKLRHANIAKILDFGREGDDYAYVSERLSGETLASWVRSHGPMPADAALRVGEQVVSVLSSAGFHKLPYPPIQPSDIMLVPGQTAEGSWPLVKVTNFGLPALMPQPEAQLIESDVPGKPAGDQGVNDQQFSEPTKDIRSEIYSLGVTLYFLLTRIALSAEALQHGPKFSEFPKPLRVLLGRLLHRDPDQRPKDLLVVTEMIRESLGKIERRRALSDRYGIPLRTSVPPPRKARPQRLLRTAAVVGVLLLLAVAIAPVVFPDSIGKLVRGIQKPKQIGVLVGVPDSSPAASQPVTQVPRNTSTSPPAVVSSQPVNPTELPETPAPANAATTPNPFHVAPADVQQAQIASAQSQDRCTNEFSGKYCGSAPRHFSPCGHGRKLISSGKHRTAASYRKPVHSSKQKEIYCLNSQTRPLQSEFGRIFRARPHWFGAQSRHGYHIRWAIDPASAFRTYCNRRTGRRRIRTSSSKPGLHRS